MVLFIINTFFLQRINIFFYKCAESSKWILFLKAPLIIHIYCLHNVRYEPPSRLPQRIAG